MAFKTLSVLTSTLLLIFQFHLSSQQTTIVKGGYWIQDTEFPISSINSNLFTHLFCGYADVNNKTYQVTIPPSKQPQFSTFTETVQLKNPSVKTLLSIRGGADNLNPILPSMVSQNSTRKTFIDSSINLARSNNFHGLDLDWQFPSNSTQMTNFGYLLTEWRAAIVTEAQNSGKPPLLLSSTVLVLAYYYDPSVSYPILAISNSLDWINVIAYGFYGPTLGWSPNRTGPSAALYNPVDQQNSGDYGVKSWIQTGLSSKKIVLGFPFYGWSWRLANPSNNRLFAPANGSSSDFNGDGDGSGGYNQIRDYISQKNATKVFNATIVSDYCYSGSTWIGYDDVQSISTKVLYAKENGLLGYFAWHVGADDDWILSTAAFQTFPEKSQSNSKTKFIVAAVVVVLFFLILFLGILWWKISLRGKILRKQEELGLDVQTGMFTFTQIKAATNDFDQANKIGEGGFGPVYKGILSDGTIVAIKQLSSKSKQGNREFITELGMISGLQHPNLVKLYGCCVDRSQLSLVYEYMENNSLARALFGDGKLHLDWRTRHKICVGIARGLAYLHEESTIKIVHRDIKSTNVLLDKDLNPKISDFGLAKLDEEENTHISTRIAGTRGYMAPEYALWGYLTYKADVYSFGVVLMEIVTGVSNAKHEFKSEDNFISIFDWAVDLQEKGNLMKLVDPRLEFKFDEEQVKRAIEIALLCTNQSPAIRPTMSSVVSMLEGRAEVDAWMIEANSNLFVTVTGPEIDEKAENSKTKMAPSYASSSPKMHSDTEVDDASKIEANSNVFYPNRIASQRNDQIMIRTD